MINHNFKVGQYVRLLDTNKYEEADITIDHVLLKIEEIDTINWKDHEPEAMMHVQVICLLPPVDERAVNKRTPGTMMTLYEADIKHLSSIDPGENIATVLFLDNEKND
jgi:hypothetical protein